MLNSSFSWLRSHRFTQLLSFCLCIYLSVALYSQAEATDHVIYRCESRSGVIFSDTPCGNNMSEWTIYYPESGEGAQPATKATKKVVAQIVAQTPPAKSKQRPKENSGSKSQARSARNKDQQCEKIQQSLDEIRDKRREGYTAKEGERLRDRARKLENRSRLAGC